MLKVRLLTDTAKVPTLAHPGEDLAYDIYSSESGIIPAKGFKVLQTGISVEFVFDSEPELKFGFLVKPRSSIGKRGLTILGGVVDAGYRGEVALMLGNFSDEDQEIRAGDKVANLIPIPVVAKTIEVVADLTPSLRGDRGFGSTGSS